MAEQGDISILVYDLVDGSSVSGVVVGTSDGQLGVFTSWSRSFAWNHPAAAVLASELATDSPSWVAITSVEVVRTHTHPEDGIALTTFKPALDITVPTVGAPADPALVARTRRTGDLGATLAAAHPALASISASSLGPKVRLPDANNFRPADFVEYLHGIDEPQPWKVCQLLHLC